MESEVKGMKKVSVVLVLLLGLLWTGNASSCSVGLISVIKEKVRELDKKVGGKTTPKKIYTDNGIPCDEAEIWTWSGKDWGGPAGTFDGNYTGETSPEGEKCFRTTSGSDWSGHTNYAGWGVFFIYPSDHTRDFSSFNRLSFWVKSSEDLKVEIQENDRDGKKFTVYISDYGWRRNDTSWQEIRIPASVFKDTGADLSKIFCPFMITIEKGDMAFCVDDVKWIKVE